MATGFTLLWSKILDSSIWRESPTTRVVWITLLAMKDADGVVHASLSGVAYRARVKLADARRAMEIFLSPDPDDSSKVAEGRRIREVAGGWEIINHEYYRYSTEEKREFWRVQKAEQRAKKEAGGMGLNAGEQETYGKAFVKGYQKRRKDGRPRKVDLQHAGEVAGASQAIADGLKEATT